jgi:16S rRNA (cytidine1402-2'-O)-methyltransferase
MSNLILVATPLGNMGDISPRAIEALTNAGLVCCEDTRRTGLLLHNLGIAATLMRVDDHTEHAAIPRVLDALNEGRDVCLVTDAGTPGISDPGSRLVRAAIDASHNVSAIPGPAALIMALIISGLPTDRFIFDGCIARSGQERAAHINELALQRRTVILYEAPHRLHRTLVDLSVACGPERHVAVCRELTKIHEEVWRGTLGEAVDHYGTNEPQGEFVLVVQGAPDSPPPTADDIDRLLITELAGGASSKDAATAVAHILGVPKKSAYNRAVEITNSRKIPD